MSLWCNVRNHLNIQLEYIYYISTYISAIVMLPFAHSAIETYYTTSIACSANDYANQCISMPLVLFI